ncbi:MAG: hypothetical protein KatS3mg115_2263 [Candidatus Poribacteria bacterium]|nr:MAG: hypothetical protein KatS3mg115_2263 [Candidatus Poribacteria bacterium]
MRRRWAVRVLGGLIVASVAGALLCLPPLDRTTLRLLRPVLERMATRTLGVPVSVGSVDGRLLRRWELRGVSVGAPEAPILELPHLEIAHSFRWWAAELYLERIEGSFRFQVQPDSAGRRNLDPLLERLSSPQGGGVPLPLRVRIGTISLLGQARYQDPQAAIALEVRELSLQGDWERSTVLLFASKGWHLQLGESELIADRFQARLSFSREEISIDEAHWELGNSWVRLSGTLESLGTLAGKLSGSLEIAALRSLAPEALAETYGRLFLDEIQLRGPLDRLEARGEWRVEALQHGPIALDQGKGTVAATPQALRLEGISGALWNGRLEDGAVLWDRSGGELIASGRLQGVSLATLLQSFRPEGSWPVAGQLSGTFRWEQKGLERRSEGRWRLEELAWEESPLGEGEVLHRLEGNRLLTEIALPDLQGRLSLALPPADLNAPLKGNWSVQIAELSRWAALVQQEATGRITATGTLEGPPERLRTRGTVEWEEGTFRGLPVSSAALTFALEANRLTITRAEVRSGEGRLLASGAWSSAQPELLLLLSVEDFDLTPYFSAFAGNLAPVPLAGRLSGTLRLSGVPTAPDGGRRAPAGGAPSRRAADRCGAASDPAPRRTAVDRRGIRADRLR